MRLSGKRRGRGAQDLLGHLIMSGSPNMTVCHASLWCTATVNMTQAKAFLQHSPYKDQPYIQKELKPVMTSLWSGTSTQHITVYNTYPTYTKSYITKLQRTIYMFTGRTSSHHRL